MSDIIPIQAGTLDEIRARVRRMRAYAQNYGGDPHIGLNLTQIESLLAEIDRLTALLGDQAVPDWPPVD